ncbi:MAG: preprotein translocase subunit SecG [Bacteroidales bacterium]|nr:preprotein translocase subunit SecG [Bacteroidales bacterium]
MALYIVVTVLILVASIFLILIVLVQNPKGGGLSSTFASSNQIMGVKRTSDFIEKATWTFVVVLLVLSLLSVIVIPKGQKAQVADSEIKGKINQNAQPIKDFQQTPQKK